MKKLFSEQQIISILCHAEAGVSARELLPQPCYCRRHLLHLAQEASR